MKKIIEMKDLGKTIFFVLNSKLNISENEYLCISQTIRKILLHFYMDKATIWSTLMVHKYLDTVKDPFRPYEDNEEILGHDVFDVNAINGLM